MQPQKGLRKYEFLKDTTSGRVFWSHKALLTSRIICRTNNAKTIKSGENIYLKEKKVTLHKDMSSAI